MRKQTGVFVFNNFYLTANWKFDHETQYSQA